MAGEARAHLRGGGGELHPGARQKHREGGPGGVRAHAGEVLQQPVLYQTVANKQTNEYQSVTK
eukprot:4894505-Pyramimonas_sp.AAC.1